MPKDHGAGDTFPGGAPPPPPRGHPPTPPPPRGSKPVSLIATSLIAVAGLAVAVTALITRPAPQTAPKAAPATDTTTADRALCSAIAPLMAEDDVESNAWVKTGAPGTTARDAALPGFREHTEDWAGRIQDVVDANPDAHPFLRRTLQRFIDDRVLLVRNMRPGPSEKYDDAAWNDSMIAYGGPQSICGALGIKW